MCRAWIALTSLMVLFLAIGRSPAPGAEPVVLGKVGEGVWRVSFRHLPSGKPESVAIAGSFTGWVASPLPMRDWDADGWWEGTADLTAGRHEYKFLLGDGSWQVDALNPATASRAQFLNSVVDLPPAAADAADSSPSLVLLRINYLSPGDEAVWVAWGLDGWQPVPARLVPPGTMPIGKGLESPMAPLGGGLFRLALLVPAGSTVDYAFHITAPTERWDNNGEAGVDYHTRADSDAEVTVTFEQPPGAGIRTRPAPTSGAGGGWDWLGGALIVLGFGVVAAAARAGGGRTLRIVVAVWVALFAFALRDHQARTLPVDIDEEDYVPLALHFADRLRQGDWQAVIDTDAVTEHPRFGLATFAVAMMAADAREPSGARLAARQAACVLAAATALLLALRWPLAGLLWGISAVGARYTSVAYLDASVAFFATGCVLAFDAARRRWDTAGRIDHGIWLWLALSAACAGLTVSSKYLGAVAPLAVAAGFASWLWQARRRAPSGSAAVLIRIFVAYVAFSLVVMVASDWRLWSSDLPGRIAYRLTFHRSFSGSALVTDFAFPWYQPVVWLWSYRELAGGGPGWPWMDRLIALLGLAGLALGWRREPRVVAAGAVTLAFLFLWPTKWPQYVVVVLPWVCAGAAMYIDEVAAGLARAFGEGLRGGATRESARRTNPDLR